MSEKLDVEEMRRKIADLVQESEGLRLALASAEDSNLNPHCAGLHVRIEELHRRLTAGFEWDVIDCTYCGSEMIKQVPDNNLGNDAMELCGRCAWEVAKDVEVVPNA